MRNFIIILIVFLSCTMYGQRTEHIQNGGFTSSDFWTLGSTWTISNDSARFVSTSISVLRQTDANLAVSLLPNRIYTVTFDIVTDGAAKIAIGPYGSSPQTRDYTTGSHTHQLNTPADLTGDSDFKIVGWNTGDDFVIDNISVTLNDEIGNSPYYVSVTGSNQNAGTISSPFATPEKAFLHAEAGDSIYVRAGVYYRTGTMGVSAASGTIAQGESGSPIFFGGYPPDIANGDSVIFDFINVVPEEPDYAGIEADPPTATTRTNNGFSFSWVNHLHLKDFTIRNVLQRYRYVQVRGINFYACNYLTLERVNLHYIGGQGIFSSNGTIDPTKYKSGTDTLIADPPLDPYTITDTTVWLWGDTTYVIDCDGYHIVDSFAVNVGNYEKGQAGTWAQAFFFVNAFPTEYQEFRNCRAWRCADDGFNNHGYGTTWLNNCWSFNNGFYLPYINYWTSGNGYKVNNVSGTTLVDRDQIHHWVTNSIAAYNVGYGFGENHVTDQPSLNRNNYNNLSYANWIGFAVTQPDPIGWEHLDNRYINNIAYDNDINISEAQSAYFETEITNSWDTPPGVTVTDADFLTLPTDAAHNLAILSAPRQADGSLPDIGNYYKLATSSNLIDAGTDVGMSTTPDIGIDWDFYNSGVKTTVGYGDITLTQEREPVDPPVDPPASTSRDPISYGGKRLFYNAKYLK